MLAVPAEVRVRYAEFLAGRGVAKIYVNKCQKWLRYYSDFCEKYPHETPASQGLEASLLKLTEKRQSIEKKQKAKKAVQLYQQFFKPAESDGHDVKRPEEDKKARNVQKINVKEGNGRAVSAVNVPTSLKPEKDRVGRSSWKAEFADLENVIRMRHYSDNTLKSYRKYIKNFQVYTGSVEPERLTAEHVKEYLTHLAVKKKVSALTQNLAFNSLLFFFQTRAEQGIWYYRWDGTCREKTLYPGGVIPVGNR